MSFWKKENVENELNVAEKIIKVVEEKIEKIEKEENSKDLKISQPKPIRSALGAGTVIQGKLSFDMPVSIDGKLSGELFSSESVIVGKTGIINAEIEVRELIVYGTIRGNVKATEKISMLKGSILDGTIQTPSLIVEEGSTINCQCTMSKIKNQQTVNNNLTKKTANKF